MNKEYLKGLVDKGCSQYEIAHLEGKSQSTIQYWLKKFGFKTRRSTRYHECQFCGKSLDKGHMYCNQNCRAKNNYYKQPNTNEYQKGRMRNRKQDLVDLKGGSCEICGYNKNLAVLSFHHKDPSEKSFPLSGRYLSGGRWENLVKEVEKCDLLCANCHLEIHHPELSR